MPKPQSTPPPSTFLLTNQKRHGVLELLAKGPRSYSEIRDTVTLNPGVTTHHLSALHRAGFVSSERVGRQRLYMLTTAGKRALTLHAKAEVTI